MDTVESAKRFTSPVPLLAIFRSQIADIERIIRVGQVEELIEHAQDQLQLCVDMNENFRLWEPDEEAMEEAREWLKESEDYIGTLFVGIGATRSCYDQGYVGDVKIAHSYVNI